MISLFKKVFKMVNKTDCCKYCKKTIQIMLNPVFCKDFNRTFCNKICLKQYRKEIKNA